MMNVSRSGFYDWRNRKISLIQMANGILDKQIQQIYHKHRGCYGYRRICEEIRSMGFATSAERIRRRMKRLGLKAIQSRKFKRTTQSKHHLPIKPNLLNQNFNVYHPNQTWVADITYIRVKQQWLYLAVVMDLYSRKVIGWAFSQRIDAILVCEALKMALKQRHYPKGVIVHTDRGSQYCSKPYQKLIKIYGLISSMSGKGNCYDNAVCESFFHTLKVEYVYQHSFSCIEEAQTLIFGFIEAYYNRQRRHSTLGYLSPINYELADVIFSA